MSDRDILDFRPIPVCYDTDCIFAALFPNFPTDLRLDVDHGARERSDLEIMDT